MKPMIPVRAWWRALSIPSILVMSLAAEVRATSLYDSLGNFVWGAAAQFEILTLGSSSDGGLNLSAPSGSAGYEVTGNVGIAGTSSSLSISGSADILGNVYLNTGDSVSKTGSSTINGSIYYNQKTLLNSAASSALNISTLADQASQTYHWSTEDLNLGTGKMVTLQSTGHFVMDIDDFVLGGGGSGKTGAILTLSGSSNSTFIFNISGDFLVGGGAKILLTGGITASDVIFNLVGCTSYGSVTGDALVNGTILATNGSVTLSGHDTQVNGQIIAGKVCIQSGADADCMSP